MAAKLQYQDNVVGPGSPKYDNAYFEISYVRTYTTLAAGAAAPQSTGTGTDGDSSTTAGSATVTDTGSVDPSRALNPSPTSLDSNSAATARVALYWSWMLVPLLLLF